MMARRRTTSPSRAFIHESRRHSAGGAERVLGRRRGRQEAPAGQVVEGRGGEMLTNLLSNRPQHREFRKVDGETHIHASDLIGKCARKMVLAHLHSIKVAEDPLFATNDITFKIGDAVHDHVRERVAANAPELFYGNWACRCGHTKYEGILAEAKKQPACEKCEGAVGYAHNEIAITNKATGIIGSPDLLLMPQGAFYVNEIKSMAATRWDELTRPVPDHVVQLLIYWWLLRQAKKPLHAHGSILYTCKDYRPRSPYKEFVIDCKTEVSSIKPYLDEAKAIQSGIKSGSLPERRVCNSPDSPAARKCEVCAICFSS